MSAFFLCLALMTARGRAATLKTAQEPPPELLENLEFFMDYSLIKQLDSLNAAEAASKLPAGKTVRGATDKPRAAEIAVSTSTVTQGMGK
jgi:hypothetical protein